MRSINVTFNNEHRQKEGGTCGHHLISEDDIQGTSPYAQLAEDGVDIQIQELHKNLLLIKRVVLYYIQKLNEYSTGA